MAVYNNLKTFMVIILYFNLDMNYAKKYNISFAELETCKEYDIGVSGYNYADFFLIPKLANNKIAANERLHLKFYVMTSMDAHILLSVNSKPRISDRVYEIVIGAGMNTFSTIRSYMSRYRVSVNTDSYIVSVFEPTPIEVVQTKDGALLVYIPGYQNEPFLNYTDPSPLDINFVSFSSFGTITAKWFYDCQFDGYVSEMIQESRPLTAKQRLIANLTASAQNATISPELDVVNFAFEIKSISLKQNPANLKAVLHLLLYWNDSRLQWNPDDFEGINSIVQPSIDIWYPTLMVMNGVKNNMLHLSPNNEFRINSNGSVLLLAANTELLTWCPTTSKNWPNEQRNCEIQLSLYEFTNRKDGKLSLQFDNSQPILQHQVNTFSEWQLLEVNVVDVESAETERFSIHGMPQSINGDIKIDFSIARNSHFYKNVFSMPILTAQILIILSFLLHGYRRGALLLVVFIILCLGMMFITRHAPTAYVPDILLAYELVMLTAAFCYVLHVIILWLELYPPKQNPSIMSVINSAALRLMLCMRFSDSTEYVNIQEYPWREYAKMLSRISLIISVLLFSVIDIFMTN